MRGNPLSDTRKEMIVELFKEGLTSNDIAERLNISYSSVWRLLSEKGLIKKKETSEIDLSEIEKKLDELPDRLVRKINEILDVEPDTKDMEKYTLNFESIGFRTTDRKSYTKKDGNQNKRITFTSRDQITYVVSDMYGKETERYYFNAQTIEAMFNAILNRGWNYFRK